jgi:hypothetical protein
MISLARSKLLHYLDYLAVANLGTDTTRFHPNHELSPPLSMHEALQTEAQQLLGFQFPGSDESPKIETKWHMVKPVAPRCLISRVT